MSNFVKGLLPWLALMATAPILVQYFLRVKFDHRKTRRGDLQFLGSDSDANPSLEKLYQQLVVDQDLDGWQNVRGPRDEEDNAEYEAVKARRKAEMDAKREQFRGKREQLIKRLEKQQQ
ncbi:hypothetical protein niasHS_000372 [Heterodera schachtii]|uniref:Uncharacterized protein n=2 Tax=Heterodera TaxID=34509 RepID=A0ABD2K649_HETSC